MNLTCGLTQYVFEQSCETTFSSPPRLYLNQSEFTTLRPQTNLDSSVIDIFADILTDIERKKSKPLNWYLPVMFSNVALNSGDLCSFLNFVELHQICENYMPHLIYCEKLLAMEKLFKDVIMFTKFSRRMARNIQLQPNGYDCGIFVIKYMQQSDNYVGKILHFRYGNLQTR
ncbi:uncharacterized protein LOC129285115 [Prosopis cineraria]|uniref:uncharacterized protein LOC129285115 n=1 Tax=Prosopis cineraria TaxID=364024 RepID=UPI00240EB20B|nr:uncharacterized protein LOC129285115 [Prosopis cineraria]